MLGGGWKPICRGDLKTGGKNHDVLTYYFKDFLDILHDRRVGRKGSERKQGLGDWNFVLKLWSSDTSTLPLRKSD
ncbi:hypothetical protein [Coleofasciculus sp. G3-WIS-01]|uniref:hypothetical protein n=1 Tax=Coleofasciculus sp. G3-WIS-01 TaxID=3069528 RepID=UPI0040646098